MHPLAMPPPWSPPWVQQQQGEVGNSGLVGRIAAVHAHLGTSDDMHTTEVSSEGGGGARAGLMQWGRERSTADARGGRSWAQHHSNVVACTCMPHPPLLHLLASAEGRSLPRRRLARQPPPRGHTTRAWVGGGARGYPGRVCSILTDPT